MSNGIEVRFMQELDHQFFMQVFWMSCCEGRLEANILTNKCIIWGLEPRSVAWLIFMSLSCSQHRLLSQHPAGEYQQGVKLYNLWGIFNIYSDHILNISVQCLIFLNPSTQHYQLTLMIIHHLMLTNNTMSSITCASPHYTPITPDVTTLWSHDAGPGVGTQLSWSLAAHLSPWPGRTPGPDLRTGARCGHGLDTRNGQTQRLRDFITDHTEMRVSAKMCVKVYVSVSFLLIAHFILFKTGLPLRNLY